MYHATLHCSKQYTTRFDDRGCEKVSHAFPLALFFNTISNQNLDGGKGMGNRLAVCYVLPFLLLKVTLSSLVPKLLHSGMRIEFIHAERACFLM